jgi:hypothetical protein
MGDFDLDLRAIEDQMDDAPEGEEPRRVVLGVLDGTTDPEEWVDEIDAGRVLVLAVEGDVNERAHPFARSVSEAGGDLVHFRGFLVVTPSGIVVDTDRL